jgi:hypothetical protein
LPDLGSARPRSRASSFQARVGGGAERGIEIVHGVADLVDRQFLGLFQLAVRAEGFFLEEAADGVVGAEEVVVGLFLLDGAEDAGLLAGIEIVDNLCGAGAQGGDLSASLKPGMTMKPSR